MPIVDKPEWIQHGGTSILGVDIDSTGERIATCGADNKVRVWSMRPVVSEAAELDAACPKLLAALADSITPVNCVRFAPSGRLLAAGSDDADVYVYELREGRGTATFGSGEAANVENWRLKSRLRGHGMNVGDVAWAPDSRRLATASVDNKVKVWDALSGHCIRTLDGHEGHVKGVAWDPFDFFLASQGDREVIVWRLEDGVPVARVTEPFAAAPIVTFALRPCWSPDGQLLAVPNGYDKGVHTVPIIKRNTWEPGETQLCGHRGSVSAVRFTPQLYRPPKRAGDGGAAGADDDEDCGAVVAVGAQDRMFSLWHSSAATPIMVGKGFFGKTVYDLAWSPDGRVLLVASYDGSLTSVVFGPEELGRPVPEAEVQALLAQLYGDPRLRNQRGSTLARAPELLQLEARARAEVEREERLSNRLGAGTSAGPAAAAGGAAAAAVPAGPRTGAAATAAAAPRPTANAAAARAEAALLEHNLAAAAALQSPAEWRQWLAAYVRRLAADEDEVRLRDLISELLGPRAPPPRRPASGAAGEPPPLGTSVAGAGSWSPVILGLDKRRILREVVLREVAKNRAYQLLVSEVLDSLKHIEGAQQAARPGSAAAAGAAGVSAGVGAASGAAGGQDAVLGAPAQAQRQPMVMG
ncbi:hypothetical protein GPECTOR_22g924 [Gonium pectorale]|uniref:Uncharacterized protein n=1 Tax=Gonium pectorale TaxID=33097 RepID=A0A150GIU7_GONPE|nr:hypothetical protein GPECTOR_22g924 [Gonium pectorale]|eukprot:KXZ49330.1 hypothetical protein GPECTOR_22g924 [Gonium pectorale]